MANSTYRGTACGTRIPASTPGANFKEAVCIDTNRVYDSVSDKNCLEDLQVTFSDEVQPVINNCCGIKLKEVEVSNVYMDVESIPFNKGFYSVDITFFFLAKFEVQMPGMSCVTVNGVTTFTRKMILFGSEGKVKVFCSDQNGTNQNNGMPRVCLQVSAPVALGCRLVDCDCSCNSCCGNGCGSNCGCGNTCGNGCGNSCCNSGCGTGCSTGCGCTNDCGSIPPEVCCQCGTSFGGCHTDKQVFITIGIFIIVQMERRVQMLMPAYDFCIPTKEPEVPPTGDPCELFKKIQFPTDSFFPRGSSDSGAMDGCGCDR